MEVKKITAAKAANHRSWGFVQQASHIRDEFIVELRDFDFRAGELQDAVDLTQSFCARFERLC